MKLRLGDLLIESGVLTASQVEGILAEQHDTAEPFGVLAERLYGVDPAAVESAWARQYAGLASRFAPEVETFDADAVEIVTRRQAWQFRVLPVRFEGAELMIATTELHLPRALRFASNVIGYPAFFVMAESEALGRALCEHYPLPGLTPRSVTDDWLDKVLGPAIDTA